MPDPGRTVRTRFCGAVALTSAIALGACLAYSLAYPAFEKQGVVATGAYAEGVVRSSLRGDEQFLVLQGFDDVDLLGRPRKRPPLDFCVRLTPAAPPTQTGALTPEVAARWIASWVPTPDEIRRGLGDFFRGQRVFSGPGVFLAFDAESGRLRTLLIGHGDPSALPAPESAPRAGPSDCSRLYAPPFSRAQLVDILGEPDWEGWRRDVL